MQQHRWQLLLTYFLFSLEMIGALLRPYFLGEAVNDLIKGSYQGLIILSLIHLAWIIVGTIRHRYDTRTYSAIYTSLVTGFLNRRIDKAEISKLSAHSTLAREFVDFLEYDLVYVIEAAYNLIGSVILLYFYDASVVLLCLAILIPVAFSSYVFGKKMQGLQRSKNDELEQQVDILSSGNKKAIHTHFKKLRHWQIRISDQESWNFGLMEFMVMIVIGIALILTNASLGSSIQAGSLIGIYTYLLKFVSGLDTIPYTVQRLTSLQDITRRIEMGADDFTNPSNLAKAN